MRTSKEASNRAGDKSELDQFADAAAAAHALVDDAFGDFHRGSIEWEWIWRDEGDLPRSPFILRLKDFTQGGGCGLALSLTAIYRRLRYTSPESHCRS